MIEVKELVKKYGEITAVNGISFHVPRGEVLGFLGPNGAGKSTTMKIITGFIPPTDGTVLVGGKDIRQDSLEVRRQIGYLPESAPSYTEMTVEEFLGFIAEVRGYTGKEKLAKVDAAVERTSLHEVRRQIIDTLSKGYRQRACFAQALLHDPPVLILDEPTDGLDPNQKHEMREVIRQMGQEKTIILSTHILEEMEAVCSRAIIIAHGRLLVDGTPEELAAMSAHHNSVVVKTKAPLEADLLAKLKALPRVSLLETPKPARDQSHQYTLLSSDRDVILPDVARFLEQNQVAFEQLFSERGRADEVFRQVTKGK